MAHMVQLDTLIELLEDNRQTLQAELDQYHLIMQQRIDAFCGQEMVERLLWQQQQQQQQQQQFPQQVSEPSQQEPLRGKVHNDSQSSGATPLSDLGQIDAGTSSSTATKYLKSKDMRRKKKQVEGMVERQSSVNSRMPWRQIIARWKNKVLDKIIGVMVFANTLSILFFLQYQGQEANRQLGLDSKSWENAEALFRGLDVFFSVVFNVELILRLYVERLVFFKNSLNVLDAIVVPLMTLEAIFEQMGPQLSFIRFVRVLRIVVAFRCVRTVSHFRNLRVLVKTIASSIGSFVYSMAIMFVCMLMLAILLAQTLHGFILDESKDLSRRQWANRHFGDGLKSLWTVFQLTFSGCWPTYVGPLVEDVHWLYALIFALYVTSVIFALTRIISALFLRETLSQASADTEMMVNERARATRQLEKNLVAFFQTADKNDNGFLSKDEFVEVLSSKNIKLWLGMLGVDGSDAFSLYQTLACDCVDGLSCDSFVNGIKRLKGDARAQDLIPVVHDCKQILKLCEQTWNSCSKLEVKLNGKHPHVSPRSNKLKL